MIAVEIFYHLTINGIYRVGSLYTSEPFLCYIISLYYIIIITKTRPLCGATDCSTRRTSYMLSKLLVDLIPPSNTQCNSTEDLIAQIAEVNNGEVDKEWIVCSLDVEALYPSLDIKECANVIEQKLLKSSYLIKGLNWTEIALYLKFHLTDEEINENDLEEFCPTRLCKRGRQPKFVASGSDTDIDKRLGPWIFKKTIPSE